MQPTIFDLDEITRAPTDAPHSKARRAPLAVFLIIVSLVVGVALVEHLVRRSVRSDMAVLQRGYILPAPPSIASPQVLAPVVTVTLSPEPRWVQIPPPAPSVWEIRAQLKRGLGEWEFPHYVNAPEYGCGPNNPALSPLKPHIALAPLR